MVGKHQLKNGANGLQRQNTMRRFVPGADDFGAPDLQQQQGSNCLKHGKTNELVCITCKKKICHNCALFGEHKGHDIKEFEEAMKEVVVRTELLMEMFEQIE